MLPRESLLGILNALPDETLVKACSAAGINLAGSPSSVEGVLGEESFDDDQLTPWNTTEVRVPGSKRPALFDKTALIEKEAAQAGMRNMQGLQQALGPEEQNPGLAPYAASIA